jgi:hypothetical protein
MMNMVFPRVTPTTRHSEHKGVNRNSGGGGTILPHSFRSLDLAPYDFRLFGPLNDEQ